MKLRSNKGWQALALAALLTIPAASLTAQEQRRNSEGRNISTAASQVYVVSAKAGGVSYVIGGVRVTRDNTGMTQILAKGDEIGDKDQISVDANGKAEILLNPGSYLRLAENTELRMLDTSLDSLKLKLNSGSALIEAIDVGSDDGAVVTMQTPHTVIELEKSGIYRINANADNTEIYVWKGAATVAGEIIKGGRKTVVSKNGAIAATAKFDKDDERDALDIWSKDRAKELAKLNDKLERRELERAFRGTSLSAFSPFGSRGFWVMNRFTGAYCFVPFGFDYWDSPYGFGYNRGIFWGYGYRPVVVYPQKVRQVYDNPASTGARGGGMKTDIRTMPAPSASSKGGKVRF
jgi:hypothetical protein